MTGGKKMQETRSPLDDMTEEEKESEADKLYDLMQRLNKCVSSLTPPPPPLCETLTNLSFPQARDYQNDPTRGEPETCVPGS